MSVATLMDECHKAQDQMRFNCAGYILGLRRNGVFTLDLSRVYPSGLSAQAVAVALKF